MNRAILALAGRLRRRLSAVFRRRQRPRRHTVGLPDGSAVPIGRIYLAGRYARRDELRAAAEELEGLGYTVTSRWLFVDATIPGGALDPDGRASEVAEMDLDDVRRSDVCVAFTEAPDGPQGRGGRHTELGIALALGQRVVLVGPREQVFHCLPQVEHYETWSRARKQFCGTQDIPKHQLAAA